VAKATKPANGAAAKFKKGDVTIDGMNFNDSWARGLKDTTVGDKTVTAEEQFLNEYAEHPNFEGMAPEDKAAYLRTAYQACLNAE
jgi:hypothetical protein